jgi:nucleoside-diphosphate-sugar epimerase
MEEMRATIFGSGGFVGGRLAAYLRGQGYEVNALLRDDQSWRTGDLGRVFYCIGLTADFRNRPFETVEAHAGFLTDVLKTASYTSFVYLSSTRVYARAQTTDEGSALPVCSFDADDLYNISKLMGEAVCLGSKLENVRVARLSNVFGADLASENFLTAVIREAVERKTVHLKTHLDSEKDYVWIDDVAAALTAIAERGEDPITNIAYGRNTTHREIMETLSDVAGARIISDDSATRVCFPRIETVRLDRVYPGPRRPLTHALGELVAAYAERSTS